MGERDSGGGKGSGQGDRGAPTPNSEAGSALGVTLDAPFEGTAQSQDRGPRRGSDREAADLDDDALVPASTSARPLAGPEPAPEVAGGTREIALDEPPRGDIAVATPAKTTPRHGPRSSRPPRPIDARTPRVRVVLFARLGRWIAFAALVAVGVVIWQRWVGPWLRPVPVGRVSDVAPTAGTASIEPTGEDHPTLYVRSHPAGARLYVDGRHVGTTPAAIGTLQPGRAMVRVELDGHEPWEREATLYPGQLLTLDAQLVPSRSREPTGRDVRRR
ncbi:MAG: PEGA domain-containing protein [Myxococcales bacterium]|nr:PEGA domain-containing protein [Myxococcales bacterium]